MVKEAKEEYDKKISEYSGSMERLRNELADLSKRKRSLMEIRDEKKLMLKMDEIMADQNRVKSTFTNMLPRLCCTNQILLGFLLW